MVGSCSSATGRPPARLRRRRRGVRLARRHRRARLELPIRKEPRYLFFSAPIAERLLEPLVVAPERRFAAKHLADGRVLASDLGRTAILNQADATGGDRRPRDPVALAAARVRLVRPARRRVLRRHPGPSTNPRHGARTGRPLAGRRFQRARLHVCPSGRPAARRCNRRRAASPVPHRVVPQPLQRPGSLNSRSCKRRNHSAKREERHAHCRFIRLAAHAS